MIILLLLIILMFFLNVASFIFSYNLYQRNLRQKNIIFSQTETCVQAFRQIHESPLQILYNLKRELQDQNNYKSDFLSKIDEVCVELFRISQSIQAEILKDEDNTYCLDSGQRINLNDSIGEVLYQIYLNILNSDLPHFSPLKIKINEIESISISNLTFRQKKGICQFLEKTLIDIGKNGVGATRIKIKFTYIDSFYILSVEDNRKNMISSLDNENILVYKSFRDLALDLKGEFRHIIPLSKGLGNLYEISWPRV